MMERHEQYSPNREKKEKKTYIKKLNCEFYLLPPYSQNGTVPSFCAKYGGLNEYLYSNRLCVTEFSPLRSFIKKIEINST